MSLTSGKLEIPASSPAEDQLVGDIAEAIDRRLASIPAGKDNVSFVVDCEKEVGERYLSRELKRRICATLERRYVDVGWKQVSVYVMEHHYLRLRVTLRAPDPRDPRGPGLRKPGRPRHHPHPEATKPD